MLKNIVFTVLVLVAVTGLLGGIKAVQIFDLIQAGSSMMPPPTSVSTSDVIEQEWELTLHSVGTLEAVQGVVVSADIPGRVTDVSFVAGTQVEKGVKLLQQDISSEQAQLRAAQANVELAKANLARAQELFQKKVSSQADLDTFDAQYKEAVAQADSIRTTIAKKTIVAPFSGRLGIRQVNVGQELSSGAEIVSLQAVDPMYVNFALPQRHVAKLAVGLPIRLSTDAMPEVVFTGAVTAIDPKVDPLTRNVQVQATLRNNEEKLLPGMFANVEIVLPTKDPVLAVPITAVAYATYGDSVFVIEEKEMDDGKKQPVATQYFVQLGRTRGDFVAVEEGLKVGQTVVVSGVFKLQNGAPIAVNNDLKPNFSLAPTPENQ